MTAAPVITPQTAGEWCAEGAVAERGSDAYVRKAGWEILVAFHASLRTLKLYPAENAAVQKALGELVDVTERFLAREREFELRTAGEFIFLNGTRLRLELDSFASFGRILAVFRAAGVGSCRVASGASTRDWTVLLSLLQDGQECEPQARYAEIVQKLDAAGVPVFDLGPHAETEAETREQAKELAKRTYSQSVSVTKETINSIRMGRSPSFRRIKRAVQGIVDQILNEETSLIGLTTLRDYDEYTFTHSVNVCIFAVALGRKLGLTRLQLYDLGMSALLHDVGKSRVPLDILNKAGALTDEEWRLMASHPWLGALSLFRLGGQGELPYRSVVVAFEHHKKIDLRGYPRHVRARTMSIFSKIVAVADAFDAATTVRSYQRTPMSPAAVIHELRNNASRGMDPVIVKAFMSLVGFYPVGTLVLLDSYELALVHAANPRPEAVSRPVVRVVSDDRGNLLHPGRLIDLYEREESGNFVRSIIKVTEPERYGIRVSDYFV